MKKKKKDFGLVLNVLSPHTLSKYMNMYQDSFLNQSL